MKKNMKILTLIFLFTAILTTTTFAGEAKNDVKRMVKAFERYNGSNTSAKAIERYIAIDHMGEEALSLHWSSLSKSERSEYLDLLRKLIRKIAYKDSSAFFRDNRVEYKSEEYEDGYGYVTVVVYADDIEEEIKYKMKKMDGRWQIVDMFILDSSLALDYKNQFNSIINDEKFEGLIKRMKNRLEELN